MSAQGSCSQEGRNDVDDETPFFVRLRTIQYHVGDTGKDKVDRLPSCSGFGEDDKKTKDVDERVEQ